MEQGWGDSYICKLSSFKIKAIIATECQMFLVEQKAIHLYKETLTKIKEKSLWTALLEWVHLSSILRTYSRVLPFCIIKIPFLSWLHWGIKDSWQSCDMPVLQFSATVLFFCCLYENYQWIATATLLNEPKLRVHGKFY